MRNLLLASILGLLLLAPTALADSSTVVRLKSGAEYHGQIVEKVPGDHLTIQLATGEFKRFEWSEIASNSPEVTLPPPAPPPPLFAPSGSQATSAPQDTSRMSFVHIDVKNPDDHVSLMHVDMRIATYRGSGIIYSPVCDAPCDKWLPAGDDYFIGGRGITGSRAIDLRPGDHTQLAVDAGNAGGWVGGLILFSAGLGFAVGGGTCAAIIQNDSSIQTMSIGMLVGGIVMVAIGLPVMLHNRTTVQQQSASSQARDQQMLVDALSGTFRF